MNLERRKNIIHNLLHKCIVFKNFLQQQTLLKYFFFRVLNVNYIFKD